MKIVYGVIIMVLAGLLLAAGCTSVATTADGGGTSGSHDSGGSVADHVNENKSSPVSPDESPKTTTPGNGRPERDGVHKNAASTVFTDPGPTVSQDHGKPGSDDVNKNEASRSPDKDLTVRDT